MSDINKNSLNELMQMMDDENFNPKDYLVNPATSELPPVGKVKPLVDKQEELDNINDAAFEIIESIVRNYVISEKWYNGDKVKTMIGQQSTKLAELQFLINSCKDTLVTLQESLDSGDINPEIFKMKKDYIIEMRNSINERSKHISEVEKYWEGQASKYEVESTKESQELAADIIDNKVIDNTEEKSEEKIEIMSNVDMINKIEFFALKKAEEDALKRKEAEKIKRDQSNADNQKRIDAQKEIDDNKKSSEN